MAYDLVLGNRAYSSWSLRAWLLFERFAIAANTSFVDFAGAGVAEQLVGFAPARTVPCVRFDDGAVVADSLAIAQELASRHPQAEIWPVDSKARAVARALAAEMHASFAALRTHCPMNLRCAYTGYAPPPGVLADLRRIEAIWDAARADCAPRGPWLCGDYSAADAFFAPVAARIAGYGLSVSASAKTYVAAHLGNPAFRRWRAMALVDGDDLKRYARDFEQGNWPGPAPTVARAVSAGPGENAACPYSGKPVREFLEIDGRRFGFCNRFCRDKTLADAQAWPAFMDIYRS